MCYKLTTVYGISHGHAAALCVAKLWRYMNSHTDRCVDVRGEAYVKKILSQIAECMGCETSEAAAGKFGEIVEKLGLKAIAKQDGLGISKDAAERLADSVNQERLKNNPIALDKAALTEMYEEIGVL
jgi:alcohol dehydrogenase class IV